jgi:methyltransferase
VIGQPRPQMIAEATDAGAVSLSSADWTQLCNVMNGYVYSQALATACDLDLFTILSANPGATQEELGPRMGLTAHGTRVLMLAVCAGGLVRRDDETAGYRNTEVAERALVAGSPYSMLPFVQFNHRIQRPCSSHLTRALQEGRNAGLDEFPGLGSTLYERLANYPELETLFQEAMGAYTRLSPKMLDVTEFSEVRHVLDVGGGDGSNAVRLCRLYPHQRVTILETPSVSRIARQTIARTELGARIECVEGDMFADPWPAGCDGVLLSHVVEIFSPEKIRFLYRRALSSLPPEGKLFVWTIMANDSETAGLQAAKSSIYFLCAASGEGMAYPGRQHEQALRETGFRTVRRYSADEIDHGALVAIK